MNVPKRYAWPHLNAVQIMVMSMYRQSIYDRLGDGDIIKSSAAWEIHHAVISTSPSENVRLHHVPFIPPPAVRPTKSLLVAVQLESRPVGRLHHRTGPIPREPLCLERSQQLPTSPPFARPAALSRSPCLRARVPVMSANTLAWAAVELISACCLDRPRQAWSTRALYTDCAPERAAGSDSDSDC
jgi:hypothetical protein